MPLVIGHRGAAGLLPENSISGFRRAFALGVDAVELDVHLSADGQIVVYHDYTLKPDTTRAPSGDWIDMWTGLAIKDLSLSELKTYDIGRLNPYGTYAGKYPDQIPVDGERIPTLMEVLKLVRSLNNEKTQLWIEIKTSPEKKKVSSAPDVVADAVIKLLRSENFKDRVKILSFDWRSLVYVQKNAPEITTVYVTSKSGRLNTIRPGKPGFSPWTAGLDVDDFNGSIPRLVKAAGGRYWAPRHNQITPQAINEAHELGIGVFVWTVDSRKGMDRFMKMGVDGIVTNRPDTLISILGRHR